MTEDKIKDTLQRCLKNDRQAQKELYNYLWTVLMRICRRYFKDPEECKDSVQEALIKIFSHLNTFKGESSMVTWASRIAIHHFLYKINRKSKNHLLYEVPLDENTDQEYVDEKEVTGTLLYEDLLCFINMLPEGKKLVFNLFVLDGYNHKEIAEMLNITESTSKAQLSKAKDALVELHKKYNKVTDGRKVY